MLPSGLSGSLLALFSPCAASAASSPPPAPGTILTIAGTGQAGFSGDGGPAAQARLDNPGGIAVDAAGNLFFGDNGNARVRRISPAGIIPISVAVDNAGRLYLSDIGNHRVRLVAPDGTISTVAGGGNPADGVGAGGLATEARLDAPHGLVLDSAGNLFIADSDGRRIRRVGPVGIISTVAGSGEAGFSGDGGPATQAAFSATRSTRPGPASGRRRTPAGAATP